VAKKFRMEVHYLLEVRAGTEQLTVTVLNSHCTNPGREATFVATVTESVRLTSALSAAFPIDFADTPDWGEVSFSRSQYLITVTTALAYWIRCRPCSCCQHSQPAFVVGSSFLVQEEMPLR